MSTTHRVTLSQLKKGLKVRTSERHVIRIVPEVECVRLLGLFFDTNKSFLLPGTLDLLKLAPKQYERHPEGEVVVFGHTDTTGEPDVNDPLSQERADVIAAYLKDDVDTWLGKYAASIPERQRWGAHEDFLMLSRMSGFDSRPPRTDPVKWFQESRGLQVDGIAGPLTRTQLITEYMAVDGTTLPSGVTLTAVGCGERFPLDDTGRAIDPNPEQNKKDQLDRRVELFFLNPLTQSPPAKTKDAYPEWLERSTAIEIGNGGSTIRVIRLRLMEGGQPLGQLDYLVSSPKAVIAAGTLAAGGRLEAIIPSGIGEVTVTVPDAGFSRTLKVRASAFPDPSSIEGAQLRLAQLGLYLGEITGEANALFDDALSAFIAQRGLPVDISDSDLASELREAYGS